MICRKLIVPLLGLFYASALFAQTAPKGSAPAAGQPAQPVQQLQGIHGDLLEVAQTISSTKLPDPVLQKPNFWSTGFSFDLGLNQTFLANWSAGGYNTATLATRIDAYANYAEKQLSWKNRLQIDYGFLWSAEKPDLLQKGNDRIYLESLLAYKVNDKSKWNYTASYDFRSQLSNNFENYQKTEEGKWTGDLKSGALSPAYTHLALGVEWKPTSWFNANFAPLTGGTTIVTIESLRSKYGMKLKDKYKDTPSDEIQGYMYYPAVFQFGMQIKMEAKAVINKTLKLETQLVLFTDYLNRPFNYNRINWDTGISWQAAKYFKIAFNTWLIYDPLVEIDGVTSKVQFKEYLSINFTWSIASGKK